MSAGMAVSNDIVDDKKNGGYKGNKLTESRACFRGEKSAWWMEVLTGTRTEIPHLELVDAVRSPCVICAAYHLDALARLQQGARYGSWP